MGWDDNGLATERRVQNYYGVRCDPSLPVEPDFAPPEKPENASDPDLAGSSFVELCDTLVVEDEKKFEELWRRLGLSVDWEMTYTTIGEVSRRASQRAFLRNLARGEAYSVRGADALGRRRPHRGRAGRARGPRAGRRVPRAHVPRRPTARPTSSSRRRGPSCSPRASRWSPTPTTRATQTGSASRCARRCSACRCRWSRTRSPIPRRAPASR